MSRHFEVPAFPWASLPGGYGGVWDLPICPLISRHTPILAYIKDFELQASRTVDTKETRSVLEEG